MAPAAANFIANSRPNPEPAPVINTTLFWTFFLRLGRIAAINGPANVFINNIVNRDICVIHKNILYKRNNIVIIDGACVVCVVIIDVVDDDIDEQEDDNNDEDGNVPSVVVDVRCNEFPIMCK